MESPKDKVERTSKEPVERVLERLADEHQEVINRREDLSKGRSSETYERPSNSPEDQD